MIVLVMVITLFLWLLGRLLVMAYEGLKRTLGSSGAPRMTQNSHV